MEAKDYKPPWWDDYQPDVTMEAKDYKPPWWDDYRKRRYKRRNHLSMEMIIRKSFVETVKEYLASSSISGIKQIVDPNSTSLQRLFWTAVVCSCLATVVYFLHCTWVAILTRPLVVTGESSTYPIKDIDFPAVALCNINRISQKALKKYALDIFPTVAKLNVTLAELERFLLDLGRLIDFNYNETRSNAKIMEMFALKKISDQTGDLMKALAPSCEEMLIKCMWDGKFVDCMSIFTVRRTVLGHCCVFNYVLDYDSADSPHNTIDTVKTQILPGQLNGLRVILDSMPEDYAYPLAYRTGFEILMFDPTHFADMAGGRVLQRTIQPNQVNFLRMSSIKQVASLEVRKYPYKTRKCFFRDENPEIFRNMYSYSACILKCRIQSVQSLCKCIPYFLPSSVSKYTQICSLKHLRCLNKYREKLQYLFPIDTVNTEGLEQELVDSLYCPDCLPDCELTQHFIKSYKITTSTARVTLGRNYTAFKNSFIRGTNLTNKCLLNVYQGTTVGILHRLDVTAYWFEILSNIGGFAGMMMGIGIYTFVEVIYFLCIRFVQKIYFNYRKYS